MTIWMSGGIASQASQQLDASARGRVDAIRTVVTPPSGTVPV
jgi:hypothetical protein